MKLRVGRRTAAIVTAAVVALLVFLPFFAGTKKYPIASAREAR